MLAALIIVVAIVVLLTVLTWVPSDPTRTPPVPHVVTYPPAPPCLKSSAPHIIASAALSYYRWKNEIHGVRAAVNGTLDTFMAALYAPYATVVRAWSQASAGWEYKGTQVSTDRLLAFGRLVLNGTDPFGKSHVSCPWFDSFHTNNYVALSQLAIAYLAFRFLLKDDLPSLPGTAGSNVAYAISRCMNQGDSAKKEAQAYGLLTMLAAYSVDLMTASGSGLYTGCHVVYARNTANLSDAELWVKPGLVADAPLPSVGVCAVYCNRRDGQDTCNSASMEDIAWRELVPSASMVCNSQQAVDSMQTPTQGVGVVDVSAQTIGGGGSLCGLAQQDESSPTFYPEIILFSHFVASTAGYLSRYIQLGTCGTVDKDSPMSPTVSEIACTTVALGASQLCVYRRSFVPLDGTSSGWSAGDDCSSNVKSNLLANISTVATSVSPEHYSRDLYSIWKQCFSILGSSPFGAGGYSGSVSVFFLCTVLGLAAINPVVKQKMGIEISLDYYFYSHFCDAGNYGADGNGCALCSYCYPTHVNPADFALPGGGSMLQGLGLHHPVCSYDHCISACSGETDTDIAKAVARFPSMSFGSLFDKLLQRGSECYVASDRTLGALL